MILMRNVYIYNIVNVVNVQGMMKICHYMLQVI